MATTTPAQGFRVPTNSDDPDVVTDMTNLALDIEKRVFGRYTSASDRNTKVPAPQDGQVALLADTRAVTVYNSTSSTWVTIYPQALPNFSSGSAVPSNASGANGDVYFKTTANPDGLVAVNWNAMTLASGWTAYGSGFATPAYARVNGIVYLKGVIIGSAVSAITTLPAGYRPAASRIFAIVNNGGVGRVDVAATGVVNWSAYGSAGYFALDNIVFPAEA